MSSEILNYWPMEKFPPRDSQVKVLEWIQNLPPEKKYILCEMPVGCHIAGTKIIKYDGSAIPVENIKVGDHLMGIDSTPRTVQQLVSGKGQMYKVIPVKGDPFIVNGSHILSLSTTNTSNGIVKKYKDFDGLNKIEISINDYLTKSPSFKKNVKLYRSEEIDFPIDKNESHPISPYFLGVLLGDGSIKNGVNVTTIDLEIKEFLYNTASHWNLFINEKIKSNTEAITYQFTTKIRGGCDYNKNNLINQLKILKLYGRTSGDKFIPPEYKVSSINDRYAILAGLIDTDGYLTHTKSNYEYSTKSLQLCDDVKFICRSLGLAAYSSIKTVNGIKYYRISISGDVDKIPVLLTRKKATPRKQKKRVRVTGFSIESVGIDNYYGVVLDKDQLYMLHDFTVTHNCGKSPIGINLSAFLANSLGNSFVLTPQKILQKQYQDSFSDKMIFSLYGKSNYTCKPKETNCDIGSDIKPKCLTCPHKNALAAARTAPNIVLNYTLGLLMFMLNVEMRIDKRKLIILDECHTLEHHLTEFKALQIGEKRCRQFKVKFTCPKDEYEAIDWIETVYHPAVVHEYTILKSVVESIMARYEENETMDKVDADAINKLKDIISHLDVLNEYKALGITEILEKYALIRDKTFFKFKPLYGKELFIKYMKPMADRFLFMSSTILDKDAYCRDLGIPPEEAAFISIDSEFDLENRPVIYSPTMKMTYGWDKDDKKSDRKRMISKIIEICNLHSSDSGVIHTGSFQVAKWLINELTGKIPHKIMEHGPDSDSTRDIVIDEFQNNNNAEPALLISPSITEGLDLKDDKGRFSIIAKVPYPFLGDSWVKRRQELSKEWYTRQAMIGIIQATGRVIRTKTDWGYNYILDESFGMLAKMYSKNIPKWFKDSII